MDNELRREFISKSIISFSGLRKLNIGTGVFLGIKGIIMIVLGLLLTWKSIYTLFILSLR